MNKDELISYYTKLRDDCNSKLFMLNGGIYSEEYGYYEFTTLFINDIVCKNKLYGHNFLSVGGKVTNIVPDLPYYGRLVHVTMIPIKEKDELPQVLGGGYCKSALPISLT